MKGEVVFLHSRALCVIIIIMIIFSENWEKNVMFQRLWEKKHFSLTEPHLILVIFYTEQNWTNLRNCTTFDMR